MKKILPLSIAVIMLLGGCIQTPHDASVFEPTESETFSEASVPQSAENETRYVKEIVTTFTANFISPSLLSKLEL